MIGARVVAYVNCAAVPSVVLPEDLRRIEPVEFELLFKFWEALSPRCPRSYTASTQRRIKEERPLDIRPFQPACSRRLALGGAACSHGFPAL